MTIQTIKGFREQFPTLEHGAFLSPSTGPLSEPALAATQEFIEFMGDPHSSLDRPVVDRRDKDRSIRTHAASVLHPKSMLLVFKSLGALSADTDRAPCCGSKTNPLPFQRL